MKNLRSYRSTSLEAALCRACATRAEATPMPLRRIRSTQMPRLTTSLLYIGNGIRVAINGTPLYAEDIHCRGAVLFTLRVVPEPDSLGPGIDPSIQRGSRCIPDRGRVAARRMQD